MSEVRELEIVESESHDIAQPDNGALAQAIAVKLAEMLASAPSHAAEKVAAIDVTCKPVVYYETSVRLELR
ncbi:MAG: hypothetical protein H0S80_05310 [Desulfovibrionaceae bacterium]|nr:hypothetical protein [Desulfovibrionaceae bacterium]